MGEEGSTQTSHLKETNAVFLTAYFMVVNSYEFILSLLLPDEDLKSLGLNF